MQWQRSVSGEPCETAFRASSARESESTSLNVLLVVVEELDVRRGPASAGRAPSGHGSKQPVGHGADLEGTAAVRDIAQEARRLGARRGLTLAAGRRPRAGHEGRGVEVESDRIAASDGLRLNNREDRLADRRACRRDRRAPDLRRLAVKRRGPEVSRIGEDDKRRRRPRLRHDSAGSFLRADDEAHVVHDIHHTRDVVAIVNELLPEPLVGKVKVLDPPVRFVGHSVVVPCMGHLCVELLLERGRGVRRLGAERGSGGEDHGEHGGAGASRAGASEEVSRASIARIGRR